MAVDDLQVFLDGFFGDTVAEGWLPGFVPEVI